MNKLEQRIKRVGGRLVTAEPVASRVKVKFADGTILLLDGWPNWDAVNVSDCDESDYDCIKQALLESTNHD